MTFLPSLRNFSKLNAAIALVALLAACGGGGDSSSPTASTPKANPKPTAPTMECSAEGTAASNATPVGTATVCMLTSDGEMVIALESVKSPITVTNFLKYVNSGYYSNTIFHRVVRGFVVQGGGFTSGAVAKPGTLAPIVLEDQNGLSNLRGTIAMARTGVADSATSQFYFNTVDNLGLNYSAAARGYAVFGRVISGSAVIDTINSEPLLTISGDTTPATEVLLYWAKQLK